MSAEPLLPPPVLTVDIGAPPMLRAVGPGTRGAPVVYARNLTRRYGTGAAALLALDDVSIDIADGELTAVMGPSGSGKSTLMHLLAGLDRPTSGRVGIAGRELTALGDDALARLRRTEVGFVFQSFSLLPMLTAEENVLLPLSIAAAEPDRDWLDRLVDVMGLRARLGHRPSELSGGQQQRVAVARALVTRPAVVFADEPTGNLDSAASAEVLALLRASVDDLGQTTVMVTHDPRAAAVADRVVFLADGRIVRDVGRSSPAEIVRAMDRLPR